MTARFARTSLSTVVVCGALAALPAVGTASSTSSTAASQAVTTAKSGINDLRARSGHRALRTSASLDRTARAWARTMLREHYFGHAPRIRASHRFHAVGEALVLQGGRRPRGSLAVRLWAHSPPHYAILTSGRFDKIGVGIATGRFRGRVVTMWVAQVGR